MTTWSEMKEAVEAQSHRDPQRAKLSAMAVSAVEDGLRHLTGVGYNFEIAPKGTLAELTEVKEPGQQKGNSLSIPDTQKMLAQPVDPVNKSFDALTHTQPN